MTKRSMTMLAAAVAAGLSLNHSTLATPPVMDGTLDGGGVYTRFATQTVQTGFGDNQSELDAGYVHIENGKMYVFLSGNLESNNNKMALFFDTRAGGQNVMRTDNPDVNFNNLNTKYGGMTFDTGFSPDYALFFSRDGGGGAGNVYVDFAELKTNGGGRGGFVGQVAIPGTSPQIGNGTASGGGINMPPVTLGYNDANTAGIGGDNLSALDAAGVTAAQAVTTGLEFSIDLAQINATESFNWMIGINGSNHDYWSNQFLAGLVGPQSNLGGDGAGGYNGTVGSINFANIAGNQFQNQVYHASLGSWTGTANGNWIDATKWSGDGVPNAPDARATLGLTGAHTITLNGNVQVAQLTFGAGAYTIAGPNSLTISGNPDTNTVDVITGSHTISAPVILAAGTNFGVASGASLNVTGNITATGQTLQKSGAGSMTVNRVVANQLRGSGGKLIVRPNGTSASVSRVNQLTIDAGAAIDLTNNDLIVSTSSTDAGAIAGVKAQVFTYLKNGYNFGGFDGTQGLQTSSGLTGSGNTTLGMLTSDEYANNNGATTFDGITVQTNDILVKYTYFGDVDFNGAVDSTDYNIIDFGFLTGASGWANGDVDYSGSVDSSDYNNIDFAFVSQNGALRRAISFLDGTDRSTNGMSDPSLQEVIKHFDEFGNAYAAGFLAQVPEPTSLAVVGLAAGALLGRRRRTI